MKVDSVREEAWRRIKRPHAELPWEKVLDGGLRFGREYRGTLVVEAMLVRSLKDGGEDGKALADLLVELKLAIPTRPPREAWGGRPSGESLHRMFRLLAAGFARVEYLIGHEGDAFASTGDAWADNYITAVHPVREGAVRTLLARCAASPGVEHRLMDEGGLVRLQSRGERLFVRRFPSGVRRTGGEVTPAPGR